MTVTPPDLLLGSPRLHDSSDPALPGLRRAIAQGRDAALRELTRWRGDFALGISDGQGRVLLAVDRFAQQTICYALTGTALRFAERADAVLPGAPLCTQALFDYLYFHVIPSPRTVFEGVRRLPAGHALWFENGRAELLRYWTPQFHPQSAPRFEALRDEFRGLLKTATARQLDGHAPACFLSGGTDSSTVAGMLREVSGQAPRSYSIGFDAQGYDEMAYARIAAKAYGCEHHEYYVTPDDLLAGIPPAARHHDQPFGNSSALPAYYCALRAKEDGVGKLLAGDGGDELFGGNARYAKQRVFGVYDAVPRLLRSGLLEPLFFNRVAAGLPGLKKAHSYIEQAREPLPERMEMYNLLLRLGLPQVLTPRFLALIDAQGPRKEQR